MKMSDFCKKEFSRDGFCWKIQNCLVEFYTSFDNDDEFGLHVVRCFEHNGNHYVVGLKDNDIEEFYCKWLFFCW